MEMEAPSDGLLVQIVRVIFLTFKSPHITRRGRFQMISRKEWSDEYAVFYDDFCKTMIILKT